VTSRERKRTVAVTSRERKRAVGYTPTRQESFDRASAPLVLCRYSNPRLAQAQMLAASATELLGKRAVAVSTIEYTSCVATALKPRHI